MTSCIDQSIDRKQNDTEFERDQDTINSKGKAIKIKGKGRHDPCVGIRAVPVGEAMLSCVLLDHYLMNKAQCG